MKIKFRAIKSTDRSWMRNIFIKYWGGDFIVSRGKIHKIEALNGFIAEAENKKLGLITFKIINKELEITTLNSLSERKGIGTALVKKVIKLAKKEKLKRVWVITTNDNLDALEFYQKIKFQLKKIYPNAIDFTRKIKPKIPKIGKNGIPIRDEIELEIR